MTLELIDRIYDYWEGAGDIAVQGQYAYVAAGLGGVQVVDIEDPENMYVVTSYWLPDRALQLKVRGRYVFLLDETASLRILDFQGAEYPHDPVELSSIKFEDYRWTVEALSVIENLVFVSTARDSIVTIDVTDITNPVVTSRWSHDEDIRCIHADSEYLYLVSGAGNNSILHIYDIEDPNDPLETGSCTFGGFFGNVLRIQERTAFIGSQSTGVFILDISDPTDPVVISHFERRYGNSIKSLAVEGDYAYIGTRFQGNYLLAALNISNLEQPFEIAAEDFGKESSDLIVRDGIAFFLTQGGIQTVTLEDDELTLIASLDMEAGIVNAQVLENIAFVASTEKGTSIVHLPSAYPHFYEEVRLPQSSDYDINVRNSIAYTASYSDGLRIYDCTNIEQPRVIGRLRMRSAVKVVLADSFAFVADTWAAGRHSLKAVDISVPNTPTVVDSPLAYLPVDISIKDNRLFLAESNGEDLVIFDVSNPYELEELVEVNHCGGYSVAALGNLVYVGDIGLKILDVTFLNNIEVIGEFETREQVYRVAVNDSLAYLACGEDGIIVVNISAPDSIYEVTRYNTHGSTRDVDVVGDMVYVSDLTNFSAFQIRHNQQDFSSGNEPILPNHISISAFPNPFNSSTSITYSLPRLMDVSLRLYDVQGRETKTIVNETRPAGIHKATIDGSELPSGVYVVSLQAAGNVSNRKIVLLR